jgi:signal transduction histidine kinase
MVGTQIKLPAQSAIETEGHRLSNFWQDFTSDNQLRFLQRLRHDLRNTLRPIREIPEWIEEDFAEDGLPIPQSTSENFRMFKTHADRLNYMIEDLLTFAHIGIETSEKVEGVEEILDGLMAQAEVKNLSLSKTISHDVSPIPSGEMRTMLDALLSNAIRHNDKDAPKICVGCKKIGSSIQISVADNGPGIPAEHHDYVFEPLTTLISRDKVEGSGLGLAIVKKITDIYNGTVRVISPEQNRGCCIVVRFSQT